MSEQEGVVTQETAQGPEVAAEQEKPVAGAKDETAREKAEVATAPATDEAEKDVAEELGLPTFPWLAFQENGRTVGVLGLEDGKLVFDGDVDRSATLLFERVQPTIDAYLAGRK